MNSKVHRASWLLPMNAPAIKNGWVRVDASGVILEIGDGNIEELNVVDHHDVAIVPGLVNAHTHLEFSDQSTPLGEQGIEFHQWIKRVVSTRMQREGKNNNQQQSIDLGINESISCAISCLVDIVTLSAEDSYQPMQAPESQGHLSVIPMAEVLGLSSSRFSERFGVAERMLHSDLRAGLSPHAPYSLAFDSVAKVAEMASRHDRVLAMHVAESPDEKEAVFEHQGPLFDTLRELGFPVEANEVWPGSDFQLLFEVLSQSPQALVVHGNHLSVTEMDKLAEYPSLSVVYCPRTHAFFDFSSHPIAELWERGIRVVLGTDSRATNPDLNLWQEACHLWRHRPDLDAMKVMKAITCDAGAAVGQNGVGKIAVGLHCPLASVPTTAKSIDQLFGDFVDCDHPKRIESTDTTKR